MIGDYYCEYEDRDQESEDSFYSDKIDSDLEAELYGLIHHEQKSENDVCDNFNITDNKIYSDNGIYSANRAINKHLIGNERNVFECNDESLFISKCGNSSVRNAESIPEICFDDHHRIIPNSLNVTPIQPKDFNQSQKRKSDSNNDVENITNKKLKKESEKSKNEAVNLESSDSDSSSIIYCEPSTSNDLQTNLSNLQSTIILSSDDSDSDSSIFKKSGFSFKKNASVPNIKFGECLSDPWKVNSEDLYRSKKFSKRYHSRLPVKCNNCKESGHVARFCPYPCKRKCYMCGGDHFSFRCQRLFCYKCLMNGHTAQKCWRAVGKFCSHCNFNGHLKNYCPDIWRRYHLTTTNSELVEAKDEFQDKTIYCYNCGLKGHFGGKCTESHMNSNSIFTWPLVISYNNPSEMRSQIQEQEHQLPFHSRGESSHRSSFHRNETTPSYSRESRFDAAYPVFHGQKIEKNYRENMNESNKTPKEFRNNYFTSGRKPFNEKMKELRMHMKEREESYNGNSSVRECNFPRSPRTFTKVPDSEYNNRTRKTQRNFTKMLQTSVVIEDEVPKIVRNQEKRLLRKLRRERGRLRALSRKNINS